MCFPLLAAIPAAIRALSTVGGGAAGTAGTFLGLAASTWGTIGMVSGLAGAATSAIGQVAQGKQQSAVASNNADLARQQHLGGCDVRIND